MSTSGKVDGWFKGSGVGQIRSIGEYKLNEVTVDRVGQIRGSIEHKLKDVTVDRRTVQHERRDMISVPKPICVSNLSYVNVESRMMSLLQSQMQLMC